MSNKEDKTGRRQHLSIVGSDRTGDNSGSGHNGGDEPPGGDELETRVKALELIALDIKEKLLRLELSAGYVEKNVATKTDLSEFKSSFSSDLADMKTASTKDLGDIRVLLAEETGTINQSVANFRTEITRLEGTMIRWFLVTAVALSGTIGTIAFSLARALGK